MTMIRDSRSQKRDGGPRVTGLLLAFVLVFAPFASSADDDLVAASKAAKEKKKKGSTTRVLTNEDVKKAKGVLVERKASDEPVDPAGESMMQKHLRVRQATAELEGRISLLQTDLAALEKELIEIERSYYEENDLDRRDQVVAARFAETKAARDLMAARLEAIRAELSALAGDRP